MCLLNVLSTSLRRSTILQYIDVVDLHIDRNKGMWLGEREDFYHVCELSTISFYPSISILLVKKNMDVFKPERQFNITQRALSSLLNAAVTTGHSSMSIMHILK